ncbi:MAG: hypothetical protein QOF05_933 [Sphingomonadales bacterium]|jgi:hypothetical protein|nr:hypothetical protein [Sphingomonadales bacterium]
MRLGLILIGGVAAALTTTAAEARTPPTGTPATVQSLLACQSITDPGQRLSCFDKAAQGFADAMSKKEVVVVDKARANEAKRSLFGFSVPNFSALFGGGDDQVNQIESTVAGAIENGYEGWTVKLADGSTWQQTDGAPVALPPRRGDKVVVRRGTMGSYYIKLGSQPGFKARRVG